jgi:hypothetical protein
VSQWTLSKKFQPAAKHYPSGATCSLIVNTPKNYQLPTNLYGLALFNHVCDAVDVWQKIPMPCNTSQFSGTLPEHRDILGISEVTFLYNAIYWHDHAACKYYTFCIDYDHYHTVILRYRKFHGSLMKRKIVPKLRIPDTRVTRKPDIANERYNGIGL